MLNAEGEAEEALGEDDDDVEIKANEEVEPLAVSPSPSKPSAAEVEEHRVTHIPFRRWCRECMMGRGLGEQRGRHQGRAHSIPIVGVDYFYITSKGVESREEMLEAYPQDEVGREKIEKDRTSGDLVKCLVIRCQQSKNVMGYVVPQKGPDEDNFVVNLITQAVTWLGHVRVIMKSDNEKAIIALVGRALAMMRCTVENLESATTEQSAKYDSQSNGATEVGIKILRGL